MRSRTTKLAALTASLACGMCYGAAPRTDDVPVAPKELRVVRTTVAPTIDGKLDEAVWESAATIEDLHQIRPGNGTPPSERTIIYVLYDKDALYVAARMWDSGAPGEITRNIMKQGSGLAEDDRLAIILDPFN